MFGKLKEKATQLAADKVGGNSIDEIMQGHWPKVEAILVEKLVAVAGDKLNQPGYIDSFFENGYEFLPAPVRMMLPKEKFVAYCVTKKEPLLLKANEKLAALA
ncbi:hypothetical protein [Photobacterium sanguinicancri]|uniref:hypothetical protein n=1 Tax=Photobacterium sanguinicancri TaxID=875932 RepID=UPI0026E3B0EC|nr:hypothetical protein [Photobacterium sanguinicancri]MDO6496661.1 hypothetical protein [Photobacterium sanguinicancri]